MAESWVRLWSGATTDPKWQTIARKSGQPRHLVIALFTHLLMIANDSENRGDVGDMSIEDAASAMDCDEEQVEAIIKAMQGRVISDGRLSGWNARQPSRADAVSEGSKPVAQRVREHRQRQADQRSADVTRSNACNADVTRSNAPEAEAEAEAEEGQEQTPAPQAIPGVNAQTEAPTAAASPLSATAEFDEAMTEYPKRPGISRPSALRAWKARIKAGANPAQMLDGVRRYAAFCRTTGVEPRFVKAPETFFGPGEHYLADWSHAARAGPASIVSSKQGRIENYWKQANAKGGYGELGSSERDITGESERIA
jgi:hypothetical protein